MRIGNPEVDAEHKRFIALLNLIEMGLEENDVSRSNDIYEELLVYVENHLPAEEAYMESIGFQALDEHKKQHEDFTYRFYVALGRFRASIDDDERRRHVQKLAEMVREWLAEHILKEIIELKPYGQPTPAKPRQPMTTSWLMPHPLPGQKVQQQAAPGTTAQPAPTLPPVPMTGGGEWKAIGALPAHLEVHLKPLEYTIPRMPQAITDFPSFQALCEGAVWRWVNKVLTFFQRANDKITRDLPPLFIASPEFAKNFKKVLDEVVFPMMWEQRRMRMLLTNFDAGMSDDESFFSRLGPRNTEHVLQVWAQTWTSLRLIESQGLQGFTVMKVKEETKKVRQTLEPADESLYDLPKIGNREIELFKALLDPGNDWWNAFAKLWKPCHDYYVQEKTPMGDPDIREGTLRDHLIDAINALPDPWGDFMLLTAHRCFPRLDCTFLESFVTNFGRTDVAREAVIPYTMRYLRQVREHPEILEREKREEEEWQNALIELRKYRSWRSRA